MAAKGNGEGQAPVPLEASGATGGAAEAPGAQGTQVPAPAPVPEQPPTPTLSDRLRSAGVSGHTANVIIQLADLYLKRDAAGENSSAMLEAIKQLEKGGTRKEVIQPLYDNVNIINSEVAAYHTQIEKLQGQMYGLLSDLALGGDKTGLEGAIRTIQELSKYTPLSNFPLTEKHINELRKTQGLASKVIRITRAQFGDTLGSIDNALTQAGQNTGATNTRLTRAIRWGIGLAAAAIILGAGGTALGIYNAVSGGKAEPLVPVAGEVTPTPTPAATATPKATPVPTPTPAAIVATATPTPKATPTAVPIPTLVPPTSTPTPVPSPTPTPYATATPSPTAVPIATPQLERVLYAGCTTKEETPLRPKTPYYSVSPNKEVIIDLTEDLLPRIKSVTKATSLQVLMLESIIASAKQPGNEMFVLFAPGVTKGCTDMGVFAKIQGRQEIVSGIYLKLPDSSDANILAGAYGMPVPLEPLTKKN